MKTYKVTYHYGEGYFPYVEYVKGKDEDDARIQAQIILDNEDMRDLNIEKIIEVNDIYKEKGFNGREDYLNYLSDEYEINKDDICALSNLLGESEDFDGLISALEEMDYYENY